MRLKLLLATYGTRIQSQLLLGLVDIISQSSFRNVFFRLRFQIYPFFRSNCSIPLRVVGRDYRGLQSTINTIKNLYEKILRVVSTGDHLPKRSQQLRNRTNTGPARFNSPSLRNHAN